MNATPTPPTRAARIGSALWAGFWLFVAAGFAYQIATAANIRIANWVVLLIAFVLLFIVFVFVGAVATAPEIPQEGEES